MVVDITIGLVGLTFFFFILGRHFTVLDSTDKNRKDFFVITGVLFYFLSFWMATILSFIMMDASRADTFFPVLRALFVFMFVILGIISTVGVLVTALIALFFGMVTLLRRRKNG